MPELQGLHRLVTDTEDQDFDELAKHWSDPGAQLDTLALLQYTSGSTAIPRGVMITHGNLLHNSALIHDCFDSTPDGRGVFWLPLFHDMGLSGGVIHTIYCGGSSTLFSPVSFPSSPDPLAASHLSHSSDDQWRAQLRLRPLRGQDNARAASRSRSEQMASGIQWRRDGPPGDARPLCRGICAGRIPAGGISALLRPRRGDTARFGRSLGLSASRPLCRRRSCRARRGRSRRDNPTRASTLSRAVKSSQVITSSSSIL